MGISPKVDSNGKVRTMVNTKPSTFRLEEPPKPPRPGLPKTAAVRGMDVAGEHTVFNSVEGTMSIAGTEFTALQWLEFQHRANLMFERAGKLQRVKPAGNPEITGSSSFLTRNVRTILRLDRGMIQEIPAPNGPYDEDHIAWMKERYSMVITKEQYGN